jgi:hypothetical protein
LLLEKFRGGRAASFFRKFEAHAQQRHCQWGS